jgi:hypothetical protein
VTPAEKTVAIVQSNYIPWKGYFDLINLADELILLDHVQYTRRDWRNRNRIKTRDGVRWLTIPVEVKGRYHQRIDETRVSDPAWAARHWSTIAQSYAAAPGFDDHAAQLERVYVETDETLLSRINRRFLIAICDMLGIGTTISWSTDYEVVGRRSETLLALCRQAGATVYLSGPAARAYLDEGRFRAAGIEVRWMDYGGYAEYPQAHPPFVHDVSIVDLLLNVGRSAPRYLKSFPRRGDAHASPTVSR